MMKKVPYQRPECDLYVVRTMSLLSDLSYPGTIEAEFGHVTEQDEWGQ
ncbi:MAG: hypothetical protein Q4A61_06360 [Porphyromonadaceae bacterium]|nr:hypothetical protein [Porphyromonadaceae bacterium]MDO4708021.1 hypothetical protein [Porphyromonadaceae bacterium]